MSNLSRKMMMGAGGGISGSGEYIEDIFSTWLYTGTGNEQFIPNQINLGDTVTTYLTGKPLTNLSDVDSGYPVSALADGILEVSNAQSIFYTSGILDVYVDMGSPVVVTQYLIAPQGDINANTYNNITGFNVKASNDASSWTTVTTFSSIVTGIPAWNPGSFRPFVFSNSTAYRYWRIEATSNGASISEWALGVNTPGSGEGGMVWIKGRSVAYGNYLFDTARGTNKELISNNTNAQSTITDGLNSFNSSGFSLGSRAQVNQSPDTYASWTFRKAPGFFDVVTYVGNGATSKAISHNLGSVPGVVIVKRLDDAWNWTVYHRSLGATKYLELNGTQAASTDSDRWFNTDPTSTQFTVGNSLNVNANGGTYVAYLFAHDAGGFGDSGNDSVIKCGSFTGSGPQTVNLGWEPQWILRKRTDLTGNWQLEDTMRGIVVGGNEAQLQPNLSNAEASTSDDITLTSTGFNTTSNVNGTWIYIAIRRGPMKTPTDATKVFSSLAITTSVQTTGTVRTTGFPVDMMFSTARTITLDKYISTKLLGGFPNSDVSCPNLRTSSTVAESSNPSMAYDAWNTTIKDGSFYGVDSIRYFFRRTPGFFDAVAYTGTGSATTISHNLGVAPELMIVKQRNAVNQWVVGSSNLTSWAYYLQLSATNAESVFNPAFNSTAPTDTVFTVGTSGATNGSSNTYIAYLFATCPGVSKVGSYTGTGTTLNVDCGFTAGARFVLIKRTDSTGDWYVWDTARGIISGNDPYLLLNSTAAEVTNTDYIDPLSSGFQISSTATAEINASGGTFVFLAIA